MKILNLTQHVATQSQVVEGVIEPQDKLAVQKLLTFTQQPTAIDIKARAESLAVLASNHNVSHVMIGGAPYLMGALETALKAKGITPLYSFTERKVVENHNDDGTVQKIAVFEHIGFIEVE